MPEHKPTSSQFFYESFSHRQVDVYDRLQSCPEFQEAYKKEMAAYEAMYASMDDTAKRLFDTWSEESSSKQAMYDDEAYMQGIRDGLALTGLVTSNKTLYRAAEDERNMNKRRVMGE